MTTISVILVTWDGWPLLEQALQSLEASVHPGIALQIIVVDNGSRDGTVDKLAQQFPAVHCVALERNVGFAAANLRAVEVATGEWVFLLNNDAVVEPGTIAALVAAAQRHRGYEIIVPQMVRMRAPTEVDNRGIMLDATGHFRQIDTGAHANAGPTVSEVFGGSGGALLVSRPLLARVPLFDVTMESYLEDADFAVRAQLAGARALYVGAARVPHVGSATGQRIAKRKAHLLLRNMRVLRARWFPGAALGWRWPLAMAYEAYAAWRLFGIADLRGAWSAWRAAAAFTRPAPQDADARWALAAWLGVKFRDPRVG